MSMPLGSNPRILVIDDNPSIHDDFRKILGGQENADEALASAEAVLFGDAGATAPRGISFEVDFAFQGHEGLDRVRQSLAAGRPYAMAFIDTRMPPGWDGIETMERIWAVYPDLQVVICTAFSDYSWDAMIHRLGRSDRLVVLKKPFDTIEALQLAAALTEKWRLVRETRAQMGALEERVRTRTQELESAMRDLTAAKDAAEAALHAKGMFLAAMSHELRTPMNGVVGMAELLLASPLAPDQRESAETIRDSAGHLLTILNDILDFSKIEANRLVLDVHDFDLRPLVEGTLDLLAARAQAKGIELVSAVIAPEVPVVLRGDSGRVRQVVTNLLGNAVKFTERGEVVVRVSLESEAADHARLRFEITDTGIGISAEAQARLFQAFSQVDNSTTRKYGGTGLGLAISRQLVALMDGEITVSSTPNQGSTFSFTAKFEKPAAAKAPPARVCPPLRVLVVDDNATNNEVLRAHLATARMSAGAAFDGREALAALREAAANRQPYDCVLIDLQLPDGPGLAVARAIKSDPAIASTRLVGLTRAGQILGSDQLAQAGIEAHLAKPAKQARLLDVLARASAGDATFDPADVAGIAPGAAPPPPPPPPAPPRGRSPVRILIADDNIVNQKVALRQVRKLGYDADCVGNGVEALAALVAQRYDTILMDCQMPEMDGFEATREIRRREQAAERDGLVATPVMIVAMTANAMQGDRERCLEAGMDSYLSKPAQIADLKRAIEQGEDARAARPPARPADALYTLPDG